MERKMQEKLRKRVVEYLNFYQLQKSSLSSYLGISPQYLSDWLHNRHDFDDEKIAKIKDFISRKFI